MSQPKIISSSRFINTIVGALAASLLALSMIAGAAEHKAEAKDIIDLAATNGNFNTLSAALKAAGLVDVMKGKGPFTVFAPTDEAFAKLPKGRVENLLKPENIEQLKAILTYHVVSGKVMAADVVKLDSATTLNGADVSIAVKEETVKVNDATVVKTDVVASNGIIHVVDTVILPPGS